MRYSITRVTPEPGFKQLDEYDFQQKVGAASCGVVFYEQKFKFHVGYCTKQPRRTLGFRCNVTPEPGFKQLDDHGAFSRVISNRNS